MNLLPFNFRFRGRINRLLTIYRCFLDNPDVGMHPTQISRRTGISFTDVNRRLEQTPELFVKLPRRPNGYTRYRLTSATSARAPEEVEKFLRGQARRESALLYAYGAMLLCLLLIVVILMGPAL